MCHLKNQGLKPRHMWSHFIRKNTDGGQRRRREKSEYKDGLRSGPQLRARMFSIGQRCLRRCRKTCLQPIHVDRKKATHLIPGSHLPLGENGLHRWLLAPATTSSASQDPTVFRGSMSTAKPRGSVRATQHVRGKTAPG